MPPLAKAGRGWTCPGDRLDRLRTARLDPRSIGPPSVRQQSTFGYRHRQSRFARGHTGRANWPASATLQEPQSLRGPNTWFVDPHERPNALSMRHQIVSCEPRLGIRVRVHLGSEPDAGRRDSVDAA